MDAQVIVKVIQKSSYPKTYWGIIARRSVEMLRRRRNADITWVGRAGNQVAHHLTKWASIEPNKE
jgi:hypothetical protein